MKIAHVCPYDFSHPGGVVSHILALERYLTRMGHQVTVIAPISEEVAFTGIRVIPIGKPFPVPVSESIARISLSVRLASRVREVMAQEKFDIVHLHEPLMPMLCTTVLCHSNTVNVGTFHAAEGKPGYRFGWPISQPLFRRWAAKLDGKVACCEAALEYATKYLPGPYEVIPDGIDLEHFSPCISPIERYSDGKINILFVGRGEKRKGLQYLLRAYQEIKRKVPQSRLIVVGPGHRIPKKNPEYLTDHGIEDVVFTGSVPYEMLPRYYKTADIFCSPAIGHESFGIVLLEAMALGKPVIASSIPGHASWVVHGREGLLVPPKDVSKLAQALMSLISSDSLRRQMGDRGLATAIGYSSEKVAQRFISYYEKLLSGLSTKGL